MVRKTSNQLYFEHILFVVLLVAFVSFVDFFDLLSSRNRNIKTEIRESAFPREFDYYCSL